MKNNLTKTLIVMLVTLIILPVISGVRAEDSQLSKLKSALPMMSGIRVKMSPAPQNPLEMPNWMGMVFDTTNPDEPEAVAMVAECFQNLPCYNVQVVPQWKFLFSFMSKMNAQIPAVQMSSLNQSMTDQYLIDNCGKTPVANFKKNWNLQFTAGENAYSYDVTGVYCSNVKTVMNDGVPQVTEYTLSFGKLAESAY